MRASSRGVVAIVLLLLILAGLATARTGNATLYPARPGDGVRLYLVDNGFHTDLAIPRTEILQHGGQTARATASATGAAWVLIGWGDERFYEAQGPWSQRIPDGLRALFAPDNRSVVHIEGSVDPLKLSWRDDVHPIVVSRAGLAALLHRLDGTFRMGPGDAPIRDPAPADAGEAYFESNETFSLLHLCNHWTAELLSAAGLPTTPVLDTLPAGLWLDLKLRAQSHPVGGSGGPDAVRDDEGGQRARAGGTGIPPPPLRGPPPPSGEDSASR
jgi:uncharacterized protein (TIGR02117 family)